jgi:hypothetical protein
LSGKNFTGERWKSSIMPCLSRGLVYRIRSWANGKPAVLWLARGTYLAPFFD